MHAIKYARYTLQYLLQGCKIRAVGLGLGWGWAVGGLGLWVGCVGCVGGLWVGWGCVCGAVLNGKAPLGKRGFYLIVWAKPYLLCGGCVSAKIALITMAAAIASPATNKGLLKVK
jgi:hypothetical protein